MKYKFNKLLFDNIFPSQREELLESFPNSNSGGNYIELTDEDYIKDPKGFLFTPNHLNVMITQSHHLR